MDSKKLEALLAAGQDSALLRYGLGQASLREGQGEAALAHLAKATELDANYSAAWKLYGQALANAGRPDEAIAAYTAGIEAAQRKGDIQAAKEMRVFLRRLSKRLE
ncbi:MAG: tetratricopeptide repeat protein [Gammaproteobacteria bacterium]